VSGAALTLRPLRNDERDFSARVFAAAREHELAPLPWSPEQKAAFLAQQFDAQTRDYAARYANAAWDAIVVDGEPAGRLIVDRAGDEIRVVDIALLPEYRGRGVGTALLRDLIAEGRTVKLQVERSSRARHLYERLGFAAVGDDGVYVSMERSRP
jgi:ribosomal protein S18 acetylase RimI-like enzyme